MLTALAQRVIRNIDAATARVYLSVRHERPSLLAFLFHALFRDKQEMDLELIDPLERTTISQFRELIEYYLEHGYRFVGVDDVLAGLPPDGNYALLTFDDGYYNNHLALPILQEFNVPALFLISTDHVLQNKSFWWDSLYRHRRRQGASPHQVYRESLTLKQRKTADIEEYLLERFGPHALSPIGDIDRPFTTAELAAFAADKHVLLGNHTAGHAILANYSAVEMRRQIADAQTTLTTITGKAPVSLAYPNGAHSPAVMDACRDLGIKLAFTVRPAKNVLPLDTNSPAMLRLGRFVPHSEASISSQCRTYRSDLLLYGLVRDWYLRLCRNQNY